MHLVSWSRHGGVNSFYWFPIKSDIVTKPGGEAYEIPRLVTRIWESRLREDFEYDWKLEVLRNFGIEGLGKWDFKSAYIPSVYWSDCQLCILQCLKLLTLITNNSLFFVFAKLFYDCCLNLTSSIKIFPLQLPLMHNRYYFFITLRAVPRSN